MISEQLAIASKLHWTWRDHQITYSVSGKGIPLVLVHGFGASIGHWRKNIPVWAEAGYRVYAIDLLGFGESDKPAIAYSLELWQELLRDFWLAHIQTPGVFIGNSIGALLSLMMAANHSEMVKGAVLLNVAGGLNHRPHELNPVLGLIMAGFTKLVGSPITGKFIFNQVRQKHRIRNTLTQVYCDRTAITEELVDLLYLPSCDQGAQAVFASILTAPAGPKPEELLPRVNCPVLVLWGEADPWTPIKGAKIFQAMASQKDIQVIPIANTGHCPHDENPNAVNPLVLNWLGNFAHIGT
ncbi:putative hydrolase or acyltransferase of alpha/beta superfamily [Synechococcus sp. PCC 7502]|uniref:alpha/beta fold hydrolase n=1 Tax=Synechococcus sp. PCC 7502 TaxID=1173263 RepID=UPI00029F9CAC|nr:alpha/beta fold hydrolase [Synechococcus sp. PCC 7502]AFY74643.1 putative hydrolase or acyltransferase of alpha/beta superfamily [Synechococcus sp. PCC 7502]